MKQFGVAEIFFKSRTPERALILTLFETIWVCREHYENKNTS